jgi:hypothetical protein
MPLLRLLGRMLQWSYRVFVVKPLRWLWQATVWTARVSWRATLWTLKWSWQAALWCIKTPLRWTGWLLRESWALIFGRMPEFETAREREIWRRIRRRFRRRNLFITHLFAFALINGGLWVDWLNRFYQWQYYATSGYFVLTLAWGFLLLFHYIRLRMGEAEDDALEAALEREYARGQPIYYEETETFYGDDYRHLRDDPDLNHAPAALPKAKRGGQ